MKGKEVHGETQAGRDTGKDKAHEVEIEIPEGADGEETPDAETPEADDQEESAEAEETEDADDSAEEETGSGEEKEAPAKKGLFGKKEKKDPLQEKIDELNDKVVRQMAEFDNFRKRSEKEKAQMFDAGAASVLEKILPVIDNFERGFAMVEDADKEDAFVDGMNKVYKQLMTELEGMGVVPIEAVGKEFDPNLHNAVMQVDTGEVESGFVAQEMQKGYMYHDTVLRFSMVAVQQ